MMQCNLQGRGAAIRTGMQPACTHGIRDERGSPQPAVMHTVYGYNRRSHVARMSWYATHARQLESGLPDYLTMLMRLQIRPNGVQYQFKLLGLSQ